MKESFEKESTKISQDVVCYLVNSGARAVVSACLLEIEFAKKQGYDSDNIVEVTLLVLNKILNQLDGRIENESACS